MKALRTVFVLGLTLLILAPLRADEAADKAKWNANVEAATLAIQAGGDEISLIQAFYERAAAYFNLNELDKAATDIDATFSHVQKLPAGVQESQAWIQTWALKGDIAIGGKRWDEATKDYEAVQKRDNFAAVLASPGVYYYNLSRAYAHNDYPFNARQSADLAVKALDGKTAAEDVRTRMLSLRQRAIGRYGEGDLENALADWAMAKAIEPKLGDAPFDKEQTLLNKAVSNGHSKERIARARFLMDKADSLRRRREVAEDFGVDSKVLPVDDGGTLTLADATEAVATPVSLLDDALNDLDMAVHRDIGDTWGLQNFDIALERGKARSVRFQNSDDHRYSAHDVDEELNRAVKLSPLNLDARRARAEWMVFRLDHLNSMAIQAGMDVEKREKTRTALLYVANDDMSRVLLADPKDVDYHITRARLTMEQPIDSVAGKILVGAPDETKSSYPDSYAALFDLDAALNAHDDKGALVISEERKSWVDTKRDELRAAEAKRTKPTGTALEWKNKGNSASAKKDFQTALEAYNTALRIDPKFADALNNRSNIYRERALWDLALHDLDDAIRIDPKHRAAYINRSGVRMQVGDFEGSVSDARRAVEVAPDEDTRRAANEEVVRALFARADSRSEKKESLAGAWDDYHEGNTLAATIKLPPNAEKLQYEGVMAAQIRRGTDAMTALRAAHAAKPDDVWIEGWLTVVATAMNDPEAAAFEKDITVRGDRNTLSNIDDIAISVKRDSPRLTPEPAPEQTRLEDLHDRLFTAYRAKPGGLVIDGGGN